VKGRKRNEAAGEDEDVYLPPSASLAGKLYGSKRIAQPSSGVEHGTFDEVLGVRINLNRLEMTKLEDLGLVPVIYDFGQVYPISNKTLYNGSNIRLKNYSIVRVLDYISKNTVDFLNRKTGALWSSDEEEQLKREIVKFLDNIKIGRAGRPKLIKDWKGLKLVQDQVDPQIIYANVDIEFFFASRSFVLEIGGNVSGEWDVTEKQ
jgi:hypothetical protein